MSPLKIRTSAHDLYKSVTTNNGTLLERSKYTEFLLCVCCMFLKIVVVQSEARPLVIIRYASALFTLNPSMNLWTLSDWF